MTKFVKYLPEHGWIPTVVCAEGSNVVRDASLLEDVPPSVAVHRITDPLPSSSRSNLQRIWDRLTLRPDPSILWAKRALRFVLERIDLDEFDLVFTTDPPSAHWVGSCLKSERLPWVMDVRDLWTLAFTYRPASFFHSRIDTAFERGLLEQTDAVVCATKGYPKEYLRAYPALEAAKFVTIPNGYDEDDFIHREPAPSDVFWMTYVGALFDFEVRPRPKGWLSLFEPLASGGDPVMVRTPQSILEAAKKVLQDHPELRGTLRLRFVGTFPEKYLPLLKVYGLDEHVVIDGYVDHGQAVQAMLDADILFLMQDGPGSQVVVPGKLFEYLRSGTPIVGLFPEGLSPEIIRKSGCGIVVHPLDIDALAVTMYERYRIWERGETGIHPDWTYVHKYERRKQAGQLADVFNAVILQHHR